MTKVLFIPEGNTIAATFIPVINELRKNLKNEVIIISIDKYKRQGAEKILQKNNILYKKIENYNTKNIKNIVDIEKPDIIVVGTEISISQAFIVASKSMNIPTLLIQHGIFGNKNKYPPKTVILKRLGYIKKMKQFLPNYLFFVVTLKEVADNSLQFIIQFLLKLTKDIVRIIHRNVYEYFDFTKMAVMGEYTKNLFIKQRVDPSKLIVTGQPKYDIITQRKFNKETIYKQLAVPDDKGIIVLATDAFVEAKKWKEKERKDFIISVVKALEGFPDKQLVIKLHPRENIEDYERILSKIDSNTIICKDIDIYELIHASEILMTVSSTTALEAMILDKPVIIVDFTKKPLPTPYAESDAAIGVYKEEDLAPTIEKVLYSQKVQKELKNNRKKFVYEQAYIQDGKATKRVEDLIEKMIKKSKRRKDEKHI